MSTSFLANNTEAIEIDFDGETFCPPPLEIITNSLRKELIERYPKFNIGLWAYTVRQPNSTAKFYSFGIKLKDDNESNRQIATFIIDDNIELTLHEIPLGNPKLKHKYIGWKWRYALSDPESLIEIFNVLDEFHASWGFFESCAVVQVGPDDPGCIYASCLL